MAYRIYEGPAPAKNSFLHRTMTAGRLFFPYFPGKQGRFSPVRNLLYFLLIAWFRARACFWTGGNLPVFRDRRNAAKYAGFFLFKTPCFKDRPIKTRIVEIIGTISTGDFLR
jgi:hypothetical protein